MTSSKEESNILKFKKKRQLNIGIIIFGIIFIYLIVTVVMYITAPHITVYEVRQGSILKDTAYTGLALREELVVHSDAGGYINYYAQNSSKVKVGSKIYTLSNEELNFKETSTEEELDLTSEEEHSIMLKIQQFNNDYQEANYSDTYYVKSDIENTLGSLNSQSKLDQLDAILSQGDSNGINVYSTSDDGIVVYSIDGMEDLTVETASLEHLDRTKYKKTEISNNTKIQAGDAVYKIITSETWILMLEIDKETASVLQDKSYVKVNFTKDDQTMWGDLELRTVDDRYIAYLTFEDSMVRYASERYLDVELILEDETGLKIPKTAETEKEFYVVPKAYITQGGNSSDSGVLKQTKDEDGNVITAFITANIYYEDDEVVYLDPNQFEENDILIMPESTETYVLSEKRSLKGVYCINKGYAVFKQINILCESDTYYIVEEGNSYGLSNYDHIALDSTNIKENDVVF